MSKTKIAGNKKKEFQSHLKYLAVVILFAVLCGIPFLIAAVRHSYVSGDDILTHMQRVEGMLSSFRAGHIPARLHLSTLHGYAYGMGFFYPQLLLLIPLLMRLLGMNFILSTNGFLVLINLLTGFSTYFCVFRITKSKLGAVCASAAALFSYYRLADLFYRGSIGETTVFIFTPLLILGIYETFQSKKTGMIWTIIGLTGILYSHLFSFLFTVLILSVFLLVSSYIWIKNKTIRKSLVVSIGISILLTASFWLPFLEQYFSVDILAKTGNPVSPYRPAVPFLSTLRIISYWWRDLPSHFCDPIFLTYPVFLISLFFEKKNNSAFSVILVLIGSAGFFLSSDLFPWEQFESIHRVIQFPWRMMFLPASVLPIVLGVSVSNFTKKNFQLILFGLTAFLFIFYSLPVLENVISNYIQLSPGYRAVLNDVGAGDYLPTGSDLTWIKNQGRNVYFEEDLNQNKQYTYHEDGLKAELLYSTDRDADVEFPFLYYKGWYYQADNHRPQPARPGPHGLVLCKIPSAADGAVYVFYQKTALQWAADILCICGVIILGIVYHNERKKEF